MNLRSGLAAAVALLGMAGSAAAHDIIVANNSPFAIFTVAAYSAEGYSEELLRGQDLLPGDERRLTINDAGDCIFTIQGQFETRTFQQIGPADLCLGLSKFIFE